VVDGVTLWVIEGVCELLGVRVVLGEPDWLAVEDTLDVWLMV